MAARRLAREATDMQRPDVSPNVTAAPASPDDIFKWTGHIVGPPESPFEGGLFKFALNFPPDYPIKAPELKFTTRIFHPNVSPETGIVCVDLLKGDWSPALRVEAILQSVSSLLTDPNPASALNADAAQRFLNDRPGYNETVREWTRKYAAP
jgi:ubiquitin-conjugating enzyme E2 D